MSLLAELRASRDEILAIADACGVTDVRVFGSVAREEERPDSDVDFLARIVPGRSLMALASFKATMEERLHRKADVLTPTSLHWCIRDDVLKEAKEL
jgi:predicted nucleotidyltransferase